MKSKNVSKNKHLSIRQIKGSVRINNKNRLSMKKVQNQNVSSNFKEVTNKTIKKKIKIFFDGFIGLTKRKSHKSHNYHNILVSTKSSKNSFLQLQEKTSINKPTKLPNLGSKCYLNSTLQAISACSKFCFDIQILSSEYPVKLEKLTLFQNLLYILNEGQSKVFEISKNKIFENWNKSKQQDSFELLIFILNEVYNEIKKYKEDKKEICKSNTQEWFSFQLPLRIRLRDNIKCKCGLEMSSLLQCDMALHIPVPIHRKSSLQDLVDSYFVEEPIENYRCDNIECIGEAYKHTRIQSPIPTTICIHLQKSHWTGVKLVKIKNKVNFDETLIIKRKFCFKSQEKGSELKIEETKFNNSLNEEKILDCHFETDSYDTLEEIKTNNFKIQDFNDSAGQKVETLKLGDDENKKPLILPQINHNNIENINVKPEIPNQIDADILNFTDILEIDIVSNFHLNLSDSQEIENTNFIESNTEVSDIKETTKIQIGSTLETENRKDKTISINQKNKSSILISENENTHNIDFPNQNKESCFFKRQIIHKNKKKISTSKFYTKNDCIDDTKKVEHFQDSINWKISLHKTNENKINPELQNSLSLIESENEDESFTLKSVIVHNGTINSGHYVCYKIVNGIWFYTNDFIAKRVSLSEVLNCDPYILFYEKI